MKKVTEDGLKYSYCLALHFRSTHSPSSPRRRKVTLSAYGINEKPAGTIPIFRSLPYLSWARLKTWEWLLKKVMPVNRPLGMWGVTMHSSACLDAEITLKARCSQGFVNLEEAALPLFFRRCSKFLSARLFFPLSRLAKTQTIPPFLTRGRTSRT